MIKLWHLFLAWSRLSDHWICEMSKDTSKDGYKYVDYHDFRDSILPEPWHFYTHTCRRCGKGFVI